MTWLCCPSCREGTAVMQCGRRTNGYVALFVFAALVGLLGQTVVPWLSDHLNSPPYLGIRFLVSNIDIYLLIVTALVTFRNTVPKRAFCRVLAFFSGLCLGYDRGDGNGEETISRLQHLGKFALLEGPQCRRWSCRLWRRSARQAWLEGGPEGRALRQVRGS